MTGDTLAALLPCYAAGDLPPDELVQVEIALRADPASAAVVAEYQRNAARVQELLCGEPVPDEVLAALAATTGTKPQTDRGAATPTRRARRWRPLAAGIAVAACAVAFVGAWRLVAPPSATIDLSDPRLGALEASFGHGIDPSHRIDGDASQLPALLVAAGAPEHLSVVPDLAGAGLEAAGAVLLPGDPVGVGIVYRGASEPVLCQQWDQVSALGPPLESEKVGPTEVRSYRIHGVSLVVYPTGRMVRVVSARMPVEALLAVARRDLAGAD